MAFSYSQRGVPAAVATAAQGRPLADLYTPLLVCRLKVGAGTVDSGAVVVCKDAGAIQVTHLLLYPRL